jgi:hypothetical protein
MFNLFLLWFGALVRLFRGRRDPGAEIAVTSNPLGCEIQLDGKFVGNTPSTIGVSSGEHTIDISKTG